MKIYFLELINGGLKKKIRAVLNVRVGTNGLMTIGATVIHVR